MATAEEAQLAAERLRQPPSARALLFPFIFDYIAYGIALSGISMATFFPMFLRSLTTSNVAIGLIPAILVLGRSVPAVFMAPWVERQLRLRYWVIATMAVERSWLLLAGLLILGLGDRSPQTMLWGVLGLWALYSTCNGVASAVWSNLVARVLPANLRGRVGGWGGGVSALTGIAVAALARFLFATLGLRVGYGLCFAGAGVILISASLVFLVTQEKPVAPAMHNISMWRYLSGLPGVLRKDHRLAWFLVARIAWTIGTTATAFYTVYAMARFGAAPSEVAWLAAAMSLGSMAGSFAGGFGADAVGNKRMLVISCSLLAAAALLAIVSRHEALMLLVFFVNAMGQSMGFVTGQNMPLELAPRGHVATYLAINTVLLGPASAVAPVLAGAAVGYTGYPALFSASAAAALFGGAVLYWKVSEPRREAEAV